MRKQNSTFKTSFISEPGSSLINGDYFAFVELDEYACYVIADGIGDRGEKESARLAVESIIMKFQEKPSLSRQAIHRYLKYANRILLQEDSYEKLKASVMVVVTNYEKARYGYAGNVRLRSYREGFVQNATTDMSLSEELYEEEKIAKDALARHEERNNLYAYLGQEHFKPYVSRKIKLQDSDIITLYTRGIWENLDELELDDIFSEAKDEPQQAVDNVEDMLLSKQPKELDNYTFAAIFINKAFVDPNRKRRIKRMLKIGSIVLVLCIVLCVVLFIIHRSRRAKREDMNENFTNAMEYIGDDNYVKAQEECESALKLAKELRDKDMREQLNDYIKVLEAVNQGDDFMDESSYEDAEKSYLTARKHSRYADHIGDDYLQEKLEQVAEYLSLADDMEMGDQLLSLEQFEKAEARYLSARNTAEALHYEEGKTQVQAALDKLYQEWDKADEAAESASQDKADEAASASELVAKGDKAVEDGDYDTALVYYINARQKYKDLDDSVNLESVNQKISAVSSKSADRLSKVDEAEKYEKKGASYQKEEKYYLAKKNYLLAKNLYVQLGMDDKVSEIENTISILDNEIEKKSGSKKAVG